MPAENNILIITIISLSFLLKRLFPKNDEKKFTDEFSNYDFGESVSDTDNIIELVSSSNENEIINIRIILDSYNIKYCILNSVFHNLYPGPHIRGYNTAYFFIKEDDFHYAYEKLSEYDKQKNDHNINSKGKIRNIFEVIFLGWIIHDKKFKGNTCLVRHIDGSD